MNNPNSTEALLRRIAEALERMATPGVTEAELHMGGVPSDSKSLRDPSKYPLGMDADETEAFVRANFPTEPRREFPNGPEQ